MKNTTKNISKVNKERFLNGETFFYPGQNEAIEPNLNDRKEVTSITDAAIISTNHSNINKIGTKKVSFYSFTFQQKIKFEFRFELMDFETPHDNWGRKLDK